MAIVAEETIISLKDRIEDITSDLSDSIEKFNSRAKDFQIIIEALEVYYNTSGGQVTTRKLSNIEFDQAVTQEISTSASSITCDYSKSRVNISTKTVPLE